MVCSGLETLASTDLVDILAYPTSCDYYFYAKFMAAFFIIVTFAMYNVERKKFVRADFISSMGVSAIATIFVSAIAMMLTIIQTDVFIEIFVIGMVIVSIWMFKD